MNLGKANDKDGTVMVKKPVTIQVTAERDDLLRKVVFFMEADYSRGGGKQDRDKLKFNKKAGAFDLTFVLKDDTYLNLKFCDPIADAIWVQQGDDCPEERGYAGGVITPGERSDNQITVGNANKVDETLTFMLRFDGDAEGAFDPPYEYDPKIINGGG